MKIYADIKTTKEYKEAPYLDGITIEHPELGEVTLDWDESDKCVDTEDRLKSCYRMKGVYFTTYDENGQGHTEYANDMLDVIKASKLVEVVVCDPEVNNVELKLGEDFTFVDDDILIVDGEEEYLFKAKADAEQ